MRVRYGISIVLLLTSSLSGFSVWGIIIISTMATVIYTTLGGLRGDIWTDVFQTVVVLGGLIVIVVMGFVRTGGFVRVFKINNDWGRLKMFDFDPNPTLRLNFWGLIFGNALSGMSTSGHRQEGYQRYAAMPTMKKARLVTFLTVPGNLILGTLACLAGWAIFAYYVQAGCDPLKAGYISNANQLVPYFISTVLDVPGLPGLFLECVAASALSTISSLLNGSAAIAWSDVIKPFVKMTDTTATKISKMLVVIFGIMVTVMAIFAESLGGNVTQMLGTFSSAIAGPMAGVFLMGMFIPWTNTKGASLGCFLGSVFALWVGFGSYSIDRHISKLPTNIAKCTFTDPGCNSSSVVGTDLSNNATSMDHENLTGIDRLCALSFMWMREVATSVTIVVALVFSFLTGKTNLKKIPTRLLHPWIQNCFHKDSTQSERHKKDLDDCEQEVDAMVMAEHQ